MSALADKLKAAIAEHEGQITELRADLAQHLSAFKVGDVIRKKANVKDKWRRGPYMVTGLYMYSNDTQVRLVVCNVKSNGQPGKNTTAIWDIDDYELVTP